MEGEEEVTGEEGEEKRMVVLVLVAWMREEEPVKDGALLVGVPGEIVTQMTALHVIKQNKCRLEVIIAHITRIQEESVMYVAT